MTVIGTFMPAKDGGWIGGIHTLTIKARLRFVPMITRTMGTRRRFGCSSGAGASAMRGRRTRTATHRKTTLRVQLDDPSLAEPINAALFQSENGESPTRLEPETRVVETLRAVTRLPITKIRGAIVDCAWLCPNYSSRDGGRHGASPQKFAFNNSATFDENIASLSAELVTLDASFGPVLSTVLPALVDEAQDRVKLLNDLFACVAASQAAPIGGAAAPQPASAVAALAVPSTAAVRTGFSKVWRSKDFVALIMKDSR